VPDGDIVHDKLPRRYLKAYAVLCEGKLTREEIAHSILRALKRDIQKTGDAPVQLAKRLAAHIERLVGCGTDVDWIAVGTLLDRESAQDADCSCRDKELLIGAARSCLRAPRYGQRITSEGVSETIIEQYILGKYRADFEDRVPLTRKHHVSSDQSTLDDRLLGVRPSIERAISEWAKTLGATGDAKKIRMPRQSRVEPIELAEDLLCI
jgi:hypothetical protein